MFTFYLARLRIKQGLHLLGLGIKTDIEIAPSHRLCFQVSCMFKVALFVPKILKSKS